MQAPLHLRREEQNELSYGQVHNKVIDVSVHFHSQIEIYLVRSGQIEVFVNDQRNVLHEGEFAVSFSYDAHGYRSLGNATTEFLIIPTDLCGEFLQLLSDKHTASPFINDRKTYETVHNAMEQIFAGANSLSQCGYIYVILGAILDQMPLSTQKEPQSTHFSAKLLIYISKHFREELTLTRLATAFGYNPSYLSRNFRKTFGVSFGKYLSMVRLREALLLLRKGNMSVTECALESGFGSIRSFYRAFYEEFKCTPREYLHLK